MMKSRTSCFNGALFRKNLTRFAPIGVLYTLCLIGGLVLIVGDEPFPYWMASSMAQCISYMAIVNLCYAPLLALLFFGDLYNGRMCNGLHAMPVQRSEIFGTGLVSAFVYSLVPTAVMALISLPMLSRTIVVDAWQIGISWYLATNLQFTCCFGLAVLCMLCAGNWYAMAVLYAACHGGAYLAYLLVDSFYTPMLDGVLTSSYLMGLLTPMVKLSVQPIDLEGWYLLQYRFKGQEAEMVATFTQDAAAWQGLFCWAIVGLLCLVAAWLLYRKRDLESAGDPIAVKPLVPVVQVAASLAAAIIVGELFREMLGQKQKDLAYVCLFLGLIIAWVAVKMVLSRSSRVFRVKNFLGLLPVMGVLGLSLLCTHMDILGIQTRIPETDAIQSVTFSFGGMYRTTTDKAEIETLRRLHMLALESEVPTTGNYDRQLLDSGLSLQEVFDQTNNQKYTPQEMYVENRLRRATYVNIAYELGHGRTVDRYYTVWQDGDTGELMRSLSSDWDYYLENNSYGSYLNYFPLEQTELTQCSVGGYDRSRSFDISQEEVASLLEAAKADCLAGNLNSISRMGAFRSRELNEDGEYSYYRDISIDLSNGDTENYRGMYLDVYPTSTNLIQWLQERDYLVYDILLPE